MGNDGATILSKIPLDNAAAKVLVEMAKVQDSEVGDGTTSVAVFCGELLREAEQMLMQARIHPQTICAGWRLATKVAKVTLDAMATNDIADDDLMNIAQTTLSSKLVNSEKEHFAKLCVSAVNDLGGVEILIISKLSTSLGDRSVVPIWKMVFYWKNRLELVNPKKLEKCNILLANTSMD